MLTRDGLVLQQIRVERVPVDKELKFTKRKYDGKLPPHEVAEIGLDDHRSNPNVFNLTVEENVLATVNGRRGFRLVYAWQTKDGYRLKRIQPHPTLPPHPTQRVPGTRGEEVGEVGYHPWECLGHWTVST